MQGLPADAIRIVGGAGVDMGGVLLPTDRSHINYMGKERTFRYVSAADVLAGKTKPGLFKDQAVWIGTSAIATYDLIWRYRLRSSTR